MTSTTRGPSEGVTLTPPVWVRIGCLDQIAAREARRVLQQMAARPGTSIVVDLECLDDGHELTMFALLVEAARTAELHGGTLTALHPVGGLVRSLVASDIRVIRFGPPPQRAPGTLTIDIGGGLASDPVT